MSVNTISDLGQRLRGRVIDRDHPDYEEARALYNGMIDKRPLLIAECLDAADVVASVTYAGESGLGSPSGEAGTTVLGWLASTTG
jgi:hypothetical protein